MTYNPEFKVTLLFAFDYLGNDTQQWHIYKEILTETYARLTRRCNFEWPWATLSDSKIFNDTEHRATSCDIRGVATGGISVYIPPKSVTVLFTCGTLTHVLKFQWLVKTYTPPPNQIPGYATVWHLSFLSLQAVLSVEMPSRWVISANAGNISQLYFTINTVW